MVFIKGAELFRLIFFVFFLLGGGFSAVQAPFWGNQW